MGGGWQGANCPNHASCPHPTPATMADPSHIQSAASKSIRPFRSSEEYLEAMKEDLAEWLNTLYDLELQVDTFLESLETGCHLCRHANNVTRSALDFQQRHPEAAARMRVPRNEVVFQAKNVVPGSFIARDNVSNFIRWCRQDLGIQDVLMFETNDLVLKKNEKNFVLCLLEVARRGSKFGMLAPMLIQMEEEIEEEMRDQLAYGGALGMRRESRDHQAGAYPGRARPIALCDLKNLDELVSRSWGMGEGLAGHPPGSSVAHTRCHLSPVVHGRSHLSPVAHPGSLWPGGGPFCPHTHPDSWWPVGGPLPAPTQVLWNLLRSGWVMLVALAIIPGAGGGTQVSPPPLPLPPRGGWGTPPPAPP